MYMVILSILSIYLRGYDFLGLLHSPLVFQCVLVQDEFRGAVEGSCIIALRCAPRNPAPNSISEYIPVYTCIYQSVHSITQYIPVCTVPGQVYPSIYQYTLVYTGLYSVYLGIYYSVQSLGKSQGLSRGLN